MKKYNAAYGDSRYAPLYTPMRAVVEAMGTAMWHFAQIKEITWYGWGYEGITEGIHRLEHVYGEYIDDFKKLLAQVGMPLSYPEILEFRKNPQNLEEIFDLCMGLIDRVNDALSEFVETADCCGLEPLARQAENIQMENFRPRAWLCQARTMAENGSSAASIDSWVRRTLNEAQQD